MEYSYNKYALRTIRMKLGQRRSYIPKGIGVPVNTYAGWEQGSVPSVQNLLKICNFLRISIWSFINIDGTPDADHVNEYNRSELAGFKHTVFSYNTMCVWLNKEKNYPVSEICERANIGTPSYYLYFPKDPNKDSIMQIDKFLKLCNVFKVWPGSFLTERGDEIPCLPGYEEAQVMKNENDIRLMTTEEKELAQMRKTIALSTNSSDTIAALQKQYDIALESKVKQEKEKAARSRARSNKQIQSLEELVADKDEQIADLKETIADLRQQLKEARFYAENHSGGYSGVAAEEVKSEK